MGLGSNLMYLSLAISLIVVLTTSTQGDLLGQISDAAASLVTSQNILLVAAGTATIAVGTTIFPNPYFMYAGFVLFAAGFSSIPELALGSLGLPFELVQFFKYSFIAGFTFALMSWWKLGGEL